MKKDEKRLDFFAKKITEIFVNHEATNAEISSIIYILLFTIASQSKNKEQKNILFKSILNIIKNDQKK